MSLDPSTLLFGFAILLAALIGGYLLGHAASGGEARRTGELAATEPATELRRALRRVEQENEELTLYFVSLPDLIRQLHGNKDKRAIGPLLLKLLDILFEPNQILIFYRSSSGDTFKLTTSKGLPRGLDEDRVEIRPGEGRIGWVAEHQVTMDGRDFASTSMFRGDAAAVGGRFIVDLCVPLVDPEDNTTLGVMSVGGLTRYPRNEKKMIKMAADLGALGIKNTEYHQRIRTLANEDSLTHLFNKRFGTDQLALAINLVEHQNKNLSVFLFDIDNFKSYNDSNGHLAGDEVLRRIGQIVKGAIRADDFAARFGGEEFLIVFHDADKEGAMIAAEKVRRLIEGYPFPFGDRQPGGRVTISGGVATFRTDSRLSTELLRLADEALYRAKRDGRNRIAACVTPYLSGEPETDAALTSPTA